MGRGEEAAPTWRVVADVAGTAFPYMANYSLAPPGLPNYERVSLVLALFLWGKARALTVLNCSHSQHPLIRIGTVIAL